MLCFAFKPLTSLCSLWLCVSELPFLIWLSVVKQIKVSLSTFTSGYAVSLFPGHMPRQDLCCDV